MSRMDKSPKANPSSAPSTSDKLAFIGVIVAVVGVVVAAYFGYLALQPHDSAPPLILPTSNSIESNSPTGIIQPTQPPITNPTATPKRTLYSIRFVAGPIPADEAGHNLYYSVDDGAEEYIATMGANIDKTIDARFSRSIRVWVDIKPGTFLYEELYVNGERKASGNMDVNGLTYQVP